MPETQAGIGGFVAGHDGRDAEGASSLQSEDASPASAAPAPTGPAAKIHTQTPSPKVLIPVLSLNLSAQGQEEEYKCPAWKGDGIQLLAVGACLGLALGAYVNHWFVVRGKILVSGWNPSLLMAWLAFAGTCAFLIALLVAVVQRCRMSEAKVWPPGIPSRGVALVVLFGAYWALVFSFACINRGLTPANPETVHGPLYEAFLIVATLEHEHYRPLNSWQKGLVVSELSSVVLLFIVFLPLLVGRLGMFLGESDSKRTLYVTLESTTEMEWKLDPTVVKQKAPTRSTRLTVGVDENLRVELQPPG